MSFVAITYENDAKVDTHKFHTNQKNILHTVKLPMKVLKTYNVNTVGEIK